MCDINKKTRLKKVTVYKVCRKFNDQYYAIYSRFNVKVGVVKDLLKEQILKETYNLEFIYCYLDLYEAANSFYNSNIINRTTGFKQKCAAIELYKRSKISYDNLVILKLVLGGDIMQGTGKGTTHSKIVETGIVYAGTEILEVKEVSIPSTENSICYNQYSI